jgi:hypothetical protein
LTELENALTFCAAKWSIKLERKENRREWIQAAVCNDYYVYIFYFLLQRNRSIILWSDLCLALRDIVIWLPKMLTAQNIRDEISRYFYVI